MLLLLLLLLLMLLMLLMLLKMMIYLMQYHLKMPSFAELRKRRSVDKVMAVTMKGVKNIEMRTSTPDIFLNRNIIDSRTFLKFDFFLFKLNYNKFNITWYHSKKNIKRRICKITFIILRILM